MGHVPEPAPAPVIPPELFYYPPPTGARYRAKYLLCCTDGSMAFLCTCRGWKDVAKGKEASAFQFAMLHDLEVREEGEH